MAVLTHGLSRNAGKVRTLARGEGGRLDGEDPRRGLSVHGLGPLAGGDGGLGGGDRIRQSGSKHSTLAVLLTSTITFKDSKQLLDAV